MPFYFERCMYATLVFKVTVTINDRGFKFYIVLRVLTENYLLFILFFLSVVV